MLEDAFNVVEMNTESVYIFKAKEERGRRLHHIEVNLAERGLEVYDFKRRKRIIYFETNLDFVGASEVQNNGRVLSAEGQELAVAGGRVCCCVGI